MPANPDIQPGSGTLDIVYGTQWGDEGKGRIVDLLSEYTQWVARYGGGDNAGHTVTVGEQIFKLHLIPSAIVRPDVAVMTGRGVVVNPTTLLSEIEELRERGIRIEPDRYLIDEHTRVITTDMLIEDALKEAMQGGKIGTTLRGIGPAYTQRTSRRGPEMGWYGNANFGPNLRSYFEERIPLIIAMAQHKSVKGTIEILQTKAQSDGLSSSEQRYLDLLQAATSDDPINIKKEVDTLRNQLKQLRPYMGDTITRAYELLELGKNGLGEGAQGQLLDLTQGTYPFVTSSHPGPLGLWESFNFPPKMFNRVIGVTKAFQTRVGGGPFPTELNDEIVWRLRGTGQNPWDEYGTTTGRPRRVGWLDGPLLRYSARTGGATELAVTKLDILSGLEPKICVAYKINGNWVKNIHRVDEEKYWTPENLMFETMAGWEEILPGIKDWNQLPDNAQKYLERVGEIAGVPVTIASFSPEREGVVFRG